MFCERCPLQSFSSRKTSTSMGISILYFLYTFYIVVILILTIFPPHFSVPLVALKTHYTT